MCGRFLVESELDELIEWYGILESLDLEPLQGSEIFPSNVVPVVVNEGKKELRLLKWGFAPQFSKTLIINSRSETIDQKSIFKRPLVSRRCIIPANGFYEWKNEGGRKVKYKITVKDRRLFSMAGIYDEFIGKDGLAFTGFSIITTAANEAMAGVHDRMPVILDSQGESMWLDYRLKDVEMLKGLLKPYYNDGIVLSVA